MHGDLTKSVKNLLKKGTEALAKDKSVHGSNRINLFMEILEFYWHCFNRLNYIIYF